MKTREIIFANPDEFGALYGCDHTENAQNCSGKYRIFAAPFRVSQPNVRPAPAFRRFPILPVKDTMIRREVALNLCEAVWLGIDVAGKVLGRQ